MKYMIMMFRGLGASLTGLMQYAKLPPAAFLRSEDRWFGRPLPTASGSYGQRCDSRTQ